MRCSTNLCVTVVAGSPVTNKFYARHEAYVNQGDPNSDYIELLAQAKSLGPKNKYPSPQTESQR